MLRSIVEHVIDKDHHADIRSVLRIANRIPPD